MEQIVEWQNRSLKVVYLIVYPYRIVLKVRQDNRVINKLVFQAPGINIEGPKELPGMWLAENKGAKFWLSVLAELKNCDLNDILIACVDDLKVFPKVINAITPDGPYPVMYRTYGAQQAELCVMEEQQSLHTQPENQ